MSDWMRRPKLKEVAIGVIEVIRSGIHPIKVDWPKNLYALPAHMFDGICQSFGRNIESIVYLSPAFPFWQRGLSFKKQRSFMQSH